MAFFSTRWRWAFPQSENIFKLDNIFSCFSIDHVELWNRLAIEIFKKMLNFITALPIS